MDIKELERQKKQLEKQLAEINQKLQPDSVFLESFLGLINKLGFVKNTESSENSYRLFSEDNSVLCVLEADFIRDKYFFSFTDNENCGGIKYYTLPSKEKLFDYLNTPLTFTNYVITVKEKYEEWKTEEEFQNTLKLVSDNDDEEIEVIKTVTFFREVTPKV